MLTANFHYEFDIAGLILLVTLFRYYFALFKSNNRKALAFVFYTSIVIVYLALDALSGYMINNGNNFGMTTLYIVNTIYFCFHYAMPLFFLGYSMSAFSSGDSKKNKMLFIGLSSLGFLFMLAVVFINPFYPWLFDFNSAHEYIYGDFHYLAYVIPLLYLVISVIYILITKKLNTRSKFTTILFSAILVLVAAAIQYFNPRFYITGFAISLAILFIFLSFHDPNEIIDSLTKLYNKEAFTNEVTERINKNDEIYIYSIALNNFTKINNTYGNEIGDMVLKSVANIFKRSSSSVYKYRYGGDRFVGIANTKTEVKDIINNIQVALCAPLKIDDLDIEVSARYSLVPNEFITNFEYLIRQIDYSIQEAKKYVELPMYTLTNNTDTALKKLINLENTVHMAIENNDIEMYYQPIIEIRTKKFIKAEALLRIKDENGEFINPEFAISYAEKRGMMIKLGYDIIEKVFDFISRIEPSKLGLSKVAINLSMVQCIQPNLAKKIIAISKKYNINPENIGFEITESQQVKNEMELKNNMNKLIEFGFDFSLDDYGSGYSTIDYIVSLPFRTIKIDKRIITMVNKLDDSQKILSHTVKMLHDVGKEVVAEGVEDKDIEGYIENLDVEYVQGYYFSKPLDEKEYLAFLRERNGN